MTLRRRPYHANNPVHTNPQLSPQGGASNATGRIFGDAVAVVDQDYVVQEDDFVLTVESTDGNNYVLSVDDTAGRVDGQLINIAMVRRLGAGVFTLTASSVATSASARWVRMCGSSGARVRVSGFRSRPHLRLRHQIH